MKLLIDMNLSPLWIPFLQQHGVEAVHWSEVGAVTAPDGEIMRYASSGDMLSSRMTSILEGCWPIDEHLGVELKSGDIAAAAGVLGRTGVQ